MTIKHLFQVWNVLEPIFKTKDLMLFLDYDGTLTPIAERPEAATLSNDIKQLLTEMSELNGISTAIVSGRSLAQLKKFVDVPGLLYVGNHGFEFEGPGIKHIHPGALEARGVLAEIAERLSFNFAGIEGVILENKIYTLSVHYRLVSEAELPRVRMIFLKVVQPFIEAAQVVFTEGKKVLEVRPALEWNKGTAISWLCGRRLAMEPERSVFAIYVGDDKTDEAALKAVKKMGLGIKVAEKIIETHADYYLHNTDEIHEFLKRIFQIKKENAKKVK